MILLIAVKFELASGAKIELKVQSREATAQIIG